MAELGDGTWKLSTERDADYEDVHLEFVKKFPGKFTVKPVAEQDRARQGAGDPSGKAGKGTADDALLHDADAGQTDA